MTRGTLLVAGIGVPLSAAGMAAAFRGPRHAHWRRLALTHGAAGLAALVADRSVRRFTPTARDVGVALPVGLGLFAVGSLADTLAAKYMPQLNKDAQTLRVTSAKISEAGMCALLALVIAPGEELFWRGLFQNQLARRCGPARATVMTSAVYGAAHLGTGNSAVTGAAMCMGSTLSLMRARGASIERLALTHAFWVVPTLLRARRQDSLRADPDAPQGRRVSRWSRLVQLANNGAHVALYEKTGGRLGTRMLGNQVAILSTARRPGGEPYSVPVFAFGDGRDVIVVASYRGAARHPAWFRNLQNNPEAVIRIGVRTWPVLATVMDADERAVWWERVVNDFQGYAGYQRRTDREIPVVRLAPRPGSK